MDDTMITRIADAVAERIRPTLPPPGWPEGRGTLSEPEAAAFLGIGCEFLRELRMSGRIACTMQGRRVTYSCRDIAEWLDRCRHTAEGVAAS